MPHQALARQYRPQNFETLVGQAPMVDALQHGFSQGRLHHAYLLTGTRGVGKTTTGRIIAKCLNCETGITATPCGECNTCKQISEGRFIDLLEVDAASRTNVEDTRDLLDNVQYRPSQGRFKIYLIDEVHMLSKHSFNALLKTLEEPPEHVVFILATTDPEKLPPTVLSRCLQFHLRHLSPELITQQFEKILKTENINFDIKSLSILAKAADGSMRDGLSLLDQAIALGNGTVTENTVNTMLGSIASTHLFKILEALKNKDGAMLYQAIENLYEHNADPHQVLSTLTEYWQALALEQIAPGAQQLSEDLLNYKGSFEKRDLQLNYQIGVGAIRDLPFAPNPKSGLTMALLRMLAFAPEKVKLTPPSPPEISKPIIKSPEVSTEKKIDPISVKSTPPENNQANPKIPERSAIPTILWHELIPSLNLTGATKVLAEHCELREQTDDSFTLMLCQKQQALLSEQKQARLREALKNHFGRSIELKITLATDLNNTPAVLSNQQQQAAINTAEKKLMADPSVQNLMEAFDAKPVPGSIGPTDHEKINH